MKISKILKILKEDGWILIKTTGSHRQFKHPAKPGKVTVAGKSSIDVTLDILNSIIKQAGLKK